MEQSDVRMAEGLPREREWNQIHGRLRRASLKAVAEARTGEGVSRFRARRRLQIDLGVPRALA